MKKTQQLVLILFVLSFVSVTHAQIPSSFDDDSSSNLDDTISSEIASRTNRTVASQLVSSMMAAFTSLSVADAKNSGNNINKEAASSDKSSYLPDAYWLSTSITEISDDNRLQSDTDIYQVVGGVDKFIGDFIIGAAITYAHIEDEQLKVHSTGDTVGITPYVAYKITDYMFASTLLGYNYTHTNSVENRSDVDANDFSSETNLHFYKAIDSFQVKGRGGVRYKHTHTMLENDVDNRDDDYDQLTWIGDIEFGYKFDNELQIYTGLLYEYSDREASAASLKYRDGIGFMRYGVEYPLYNNFKVSAKIEHDINDEDDDYITGGINARFEY